MSAFKVWYKIKKEWEKRPCVIDQEGKLFVVRNGVVIELNIDNHEVCWRTGLEDKNGREIYKGDIIVSDDYPFFSDGGIKYVGVVEWIHSSWQFIKHCVSTSIRGISDGVNDYIDDGSGVMEFRVIGNIYDNPELLEQQHD